MGFFSDRPTNRPPPSGSVQIGPEPAPVQAPAPLPLPGAHRKAMLELYKLWGSVLASLAAGILSAYGFLDGLLDKRITAAVARHNEDRAGVEHPLLRSRLEHLEEELKALRDVVPAHTTKIERAYKALYEIYWFRVGEKAIELEPDRRRHAQVRAQVQREFEQLVREGDSLEDAYRRALSQAAGLP